MTENFKINPIPYQYNRVTIDLIFKNTNKAIEFYKKVFNAKELNKFEIDNKVVHAEIMIGDTRIMLADENLKNDIKSAETIGNSGIGLVIFVENVDEVVKLAIKEGSKLVCNNENDTKYFAEYKADCITNTKYGLREGHIIDPFGYRWNISSVREAITEEILKQRYGNIYKNYENKNQSGGENEMFKEKYYKYKLKYAQFKNKKK